MRNVNLLGTEVEFNKYASVTKGIFMVSIEEAIGQFIWSINFIFNDRHRSGMCKSLDEAIDIINKEVKKISSEMIELAGL